MGHALPDCIGITRVGEDVSEYIYLDAHLDERAGAPAPGGWFTARWLDETGAMFVWSRHADGYYNGSAHFNGAVTTRLSEIAWIDDTVYATASVLDPEGHLATRLWVASGQFPYFGDLDRDTLHDAVITGLARDVRVYASTEAFEDSGDGDMGPLREPVELPDGAMLDRIRFTVGGFIPTGMFDGGSPMAWLSGAVEESFAYTVADTGATVHVARVTAVGCLVIYVCWPECLAPVPAVGTVIQVNAYLTAFIPALWCQEVTE